MLSGQQQVGLASRAPSNLKQLCEHLETSVCIFMS
jgi:hypothetical protein